MSFYEQFLAFIVWQDEDASEEDGYGSVLVRPIDNSRCCCEGTNS